MAAKKFDSSDYPEIGKASDAYAVAKAEFQKLDRLLKETPTNASNYKSLVEQRNSAKDKMDTALRLFQDVTRKRKQEFEESQKKEESQRKEETLKRKLEVLKDQRQRAVDTNSSTTEIDDEIEKAQSEFNSIIAGRKKPEGKKTTDRPEGVPDAAVFSSVTGQWTLGTKKWDKTGKSITTSKQKKQVVTDTDETAVTGAAGEGFAAGTFRKADEASLEGTFTPITGATIDEIFAKAASVYGGIDEIFKTNEDLKALLTRAIGKIDDPKDDYKVERFISELENTKWFKQNAGPIRQRGFYKRQYDALEKELKTDDPNYRQKLAELRKTSEYGRGLQSAEETVREFATQLLGANALDDGTIKSIASDIYNYANEEDDVKIRNAVLAAAKYGKGAVIGGLSGKNLSALKAIAGANGFDLEKNFGNSLPTWLDNLSKGESIETYKKIIRDAAKTSFNVSDRVASLLDQGVDLETVYQPYMNVMAKILELNPEEVTLRDLADKGVIANKDQMNLYDFQKVLRKDSRWQFTENAREEVSNVALQVLRDFGFQG